MFDYVFGTFIVVAIVVVFIVIGRLALEMKTERLSRKLGEEMLRRAKKIGVLVYTNSASSVLAVCLAGELIDAFEKYKEAVRKGEKKPWDRVLLFAKDTFSFWQSEDAQNLMHVGPASDAHEIIHEIIEKATGIKSTAVNNFIYRCHVYPTLVQEDKRLFVPFSGSVPNAEWQMKFYGQESLEDAKADLLDNVPAYRS